jgi:hypothetical protein
LLSHLNVCCEFVSFFKWRENVFPFTSNSQLQPVRLAYQPPASSTFFSEQISHQQPASSTFSSEQTSTSHQPPAKRTGRLCCKFDNVIVSKKRS